MVKMGNFMLQREVPEIGRKFGYFAVSIMEGEFRTISGLE
jgi:hypothetical protein